MPSHGWTPKPPASQMQLAACAVFVGICHRPPTDATDRHSELSPGMNSARWGGRPTTTHPANVRAWRTARFVGILGHRAKIHADIETTKNHATIEGGPSKNVLIPFV